MAEKYDVIVVGAGPAGCAAALEVKRQGLSVLVIEKKSMKDLLDQKTTNFQALQNLTQREDARDMFSKWGCHFKPAGPYLGARVHGPYGTTVDFRLNRLHGYFVRRGGRGSLEHQLLQQVKNKGIQVFMNTPVIYASKDGVIELKRNGKILRMKGEWIIGADGKATVVGKAFVKPLSRNDVGIGIGFHYKGNHGFTPGIVETWLGKRLCPGAYTYVIPTEDEVTVVATMMPYLMPHGTTPKDYLDRLLSIPSVKERLKGTKKVGLVGGSVPVTNERVLGMGNIILCGEAARLTEPLLGFGIKNAVLSGHLAGNAVVSNNPLEFYSKEIKDRILVDLNRKMTTRKSIIERCTDRDIHEVLTIINTTMKKIDPNGLFDPKQRKITMLKALMSIRSPRKVHIALKILIPFMRANFPSYPVG